MEIQVYYCWEWKLWGVCVMDTRTSTMVGESDWFHRKVDAVAEARRIKREGYAASYTIDISNK